MARSGPKAFFQELRRRRVLPIAGAYIAIAWLVTEIAGYTLEQTGAPAWALRLLAIVFMVGFPVTAVLAWVVQVGLDGKRTLDSSKGQHKTVIGAIILGVIATAGLAWLILPRIERAPDIPGYEPLPNSVAILPFASPGSTPREIDIGETLYTALTNGMNTSKDLNQIQIRFRPPGTLVTLGRRFGAVTVLAGRVRSSAGKTWVEIDLLDVASGALRWERHFDWDSTNTYEIGTEIVNGVLHSMGLTTVSATEFMGTDNPEAYEALLTARKLAWTRHQSKEIIEAIEHCQRAVDADPGYVQAYVELALTTWMVDPENLDNEARQVLQKRHKQALETAQQLAPESPDVISLLGRMAWENEQPDVAKRAFERALELDPGHLRTIHRYAMVLYQAGGWSDMERSLELQRRLVRSDPLNANHRQNIADLLWSLGRYEEARAELQKSIALEPALKGSYHLLARWEGWDVGRYDTALYYQIKAHELEEPTPRGGIVASLYATLGAKEEAIAWMGGQTGLLEVLESDEPPCNHDVFVLLDQMETAYQCVDRRFASQPDSCEMMVLRSLRDIRAGDAERALLRFQQCRPHLTGSENSVIDREFPWAVYARTRFSWVLMEGGKEESARRTLTQVLDFLNGFCGEEKLAGEKWHICGWKWKAHAIAQQKEETLVELRRMIVNEHYRQPIDRQPFEKRILEFLHDDPEYQRLLNIINDDLATQLENVREMERNGEIQPPPRPEVIP